jgi:hypothetical protein
MFVCIKICQIHIMSILIMFFLCEKDQETNQCV